MSQLSPALSAYRRHHYPSRRCVTVILIGTMLVSDLPPARPYCIIVGKLAKCVVNLLRRSLLSSSWHLTDASCARSSESGSFNAHARVCVDNFTLTTLSTALHEVAKVKIGSVR